MKLVRPRGESFFGGSIAAGAKLDDMGAEDGGVGGGVEVREVGGRVGGGKVRDEAGGGGVESSANNLLHLAGVDINAAAESGHGWAIEVFWGFLRKLVMPLSEMFGGGIVPAAGRKCGDALLGCRTR